MQMRFHQVRMRRRREVEVTEDDSLTLEAGHELRGDHLGVALDLQAGSLSDDAGRLEQTVAVDRLGSTTGRERDEVQIEVRQVGVAPLLGLLRRDGHGLELRERSQTELAGEPRDLGKLREGVLVE